MSKEQAQAAQSTPDAKHQDPVASQRTPKQEKIIQRIMNAAEVHRNKIDDENVPLPARAESNLDLARAVLNLPTNGENLYHGEDCTMVALRAFIDALTYDDSIPTNEVKNNRVVDGITKILDILQPKMTAAASREEFSVIKSQHDAVTSFVEKFAYNEAQSIQKAQTEWANAQAPLEIKFGKNKGAIHAASKRADEVAEVVTDLFDTLCSQALKKLTAVGGIFKNLGSKKNLHDGAGAKEDSKTPNQTSKSNVDDPTKVLKEALEPHANNDEHVTEAIPVIGASNDHNNGGAHKTDSSRCCSIV